MKVSLLAHVWPIVMVQGPVPAIARDGVHEVPMPLATTRWPVGSDQPTGITRVVAEPAGNVAPAGAANVKV